MLRQSIYRLVVVQGRTTYRGEIKSIVKEIMFPTGYAIGEDMFFLFQYLLRIQRVAVDTTESLYRYCIRSNSAMKSTWMMFMNTLQNCVVNMAYRFMTLTT